jgi:uncharacterized protein (DUF433 family)
MRPFYLRSVKFENYITIVPGVRSGKPCIKGTPITVADVLEYLAGGMTEAEILADFPTLSSEPVWRSLPHGNAALRFAQRCETTL